MMCITAEQAWLSVQGVYADPHSQLHHAQPLFRHPARYLLDNSGALLLGHELADVIRDMQQEATSSTRTHTRTHTRTNTHTHTQALDSKTVSGRVYVLQTPE
jgi:hypothetical protein